jgi:hypothetical protein
VSVVRRNEEAAEAGVDRLDFDLRNCETAISKLTVCSRRRET